MRQFIALCGFRIMSSAAQLTIKTFGGLSATFRDGTLARLQTNRARALLLFLVAQGGRFVHRDIVVAALWPDCGEAEGRAQLRKALWRIRSALMDLGPALQAAEDQLRLEGSGIEVDLWQLTGAIAAFDRTGGDAAAGAALMQALDRLSGDFGAGIFDGWCVELALGLLQERLAATERVVLRLQREGQFLQAAHWAHRGLALDPLAEQLHRALMECHLSMGDAASALRQFETCRGLLAGSLGITPSAETLAVRDAVASATMPRGGGGTRPAGCAVAARGALDRVK